MTKPTMLNSNYKYEMLLVLPVPFRLINGELHVEFQAYLGLERWLESFSSLCLAAPVLTAKAEKKGSTIIWRSVADLTDRIDFVPLPYAYSVQAFLKNIASSRALLRDKIRKSKYLQFAIYELCGDWSGVAAEEAFRLKRSYAVHMDNVAHEFAFRMANGLPWHKKIVRRLSSFGMQYWHRKLISRSSLALCHGADCFNAYQSWTSSAAVVHNVHDLLVHGDDRGSEVEHAHKRNEMKDRSYLKICYAGRIDKEKAPLDWVQAIGCAVRKGVPIKATWLGDGPHRSQMQAEVQRLGLADIIELPGFIADRERVLACIREADLMLFTHITPESPRCLIESLRAGTPIVGYSSAYPRDLVAEYHGGRFVPMHDWNQLGGELVDLANNRTELGGLMDKAYADGERFSSRAVFKHRSDLIKQFLTH